jgi:hypothetical protein
MAETCLPNFLCHFEMVIIRLASCEECVAISQVDIIPRVLHLELVCGEVSVKHETAHILEPPAGYRQVEKAQLDYLLFGVFAPPWGQIYTRLGAGCTKQG